MHFFSRRELLIGASALAAMVSPTHRANAAPPLSLKLSYAGPILRPVHDEIARRFSTAHPHISIAYNPPVRAYEELIQQVLRGAIVGDIPDIAFHTLGSMRIFETRGLATPVDDLIDTDFLQQGYSSTMLQMGKLGGKTLSVPFEVSAPIVFYNLALIEKAGRDPSRLPSTWDEIVDLIGKIGSLGDNTTGGHFEYDQSGAWMLQALVMSQGGRMLDARGTALALNNEIGLQAFNILQALGKAGMIDMSRDQARQVFSSGKLGVLISSSSILNALKTQVSKKFDIGVGEFPISSPEGTIPAGGNAAVVHAKDPQRVKAAWEYIKFATGPVGQPISVKHTGYLPVNDRALALKDIVGPAADDRNFQNAVRFLPRLAAPTDFPGENAIKITKIMTDHMQFVLTLKENPKEALRSMVRDVNAIIT